MARQPKKLATPITILAWLFIITILAWLFICGRTPIMTDNTTPTRIVTPGGEIVISTPAGFTAYDDWNSAPARRALRSRLQASGANFPDVVMINSFDDWSATEFHGDRMEQFKAFREVKAEFMLPPHPAWTVVGTSDRPCRLRRSHPRHRTLRWNQTPFRLLTPSGDPG
jgi:enamine deaminase RidA (YjgF/YER057c/UK114 family)